VGWTRWFSRAQGLFYLAMINRWRSIIIDPHERFNRNRGR